MKSIFVDRDAYRAEMKLIMDDIAELIDDPNSMYPRSTMIYPILVLMLANRYIWENEASARSRGKGGKLRATHAVNGVRNRAKNEISKIFGERIDTKIDCLAADLPTDVGDWRVFD